MQVASCSRGPSLSTEPPDNFSKKLSVSPTPVLTLVFGFMDNAITASTSCS